MQSRSHVMASQLVLVPTLIIVVYFLWGFTLYTGYLSFTDSKFLPSHKWLGLKQYELLWSNHRWKIAYANMFIFGGLYLFFCVLFGGLFAILLDQRIRLENFFRTTFLYPMSLSLVVTGLAWQWMLNPSLGLQKLAHEMGFHEFTLDWVVSSKYAIYTVVLAAVWHGTGLIMVLFLAGLRAVDKDIWKSIYVEGIPAWRAYGAIIRFASDVPAKFIYDYFFARSNIARGAAAAVCTVMTVLLIILPYLYLELRKQK